MRADPRTQELRIVASETAVTMHRAILKHGAELTDAEYLYVLSLVNLDLSNSILRAARP